MSNLLVRSIPVVTVVVGMATGYAFFKPMVIEQLQKDGALNAQAEMELHQLEKRPIQEVEKK